MSKPLNITYQCLASHAQDTPEKIALTIVDENLNIQHQLSYQTLYQKVACLSHGLNSLNLASGSRILIRSFKNLDFILLFFASMAAGLVPISSLSNLSKREEQFILEDSQAKLFYQQSDIAITLDVPLHCHALNQDEFEQLKQYPLIPLDEKTDSESPAFITYTSGSTSKPKGVMHAHRVILGREPLRQQWLDLQADDIVLHTGKPCWTYSMGVGFFDTWYKGATSIVYLGDENPAAWFSLIEKFNVTIFASSPLYFRELEKVTPTHPQQLKSLRHAFSAGEKLPQTIIDHWQQQYNIPIYEALGMSEMSTFISFGPNIATRPGSVGKLQAKRNVCLLPLEGGIKPVAAGETGLLAIHRDNLGFMLGYLNRPQEMKTHFRDDWFLSGDLMRQDDDGYFWYIGRYDDVLNIAGGHRVSPLEIERILEQHPQVKQAICHLGQNAHLTNLLQASIMLKEGTPTEELAGEIHQWCQQYLSENKTPALIAFAKKFPTKTNGKIDRKNIKNSKHISTTFEFN